MQITTSGYVREIWGRRGRPGSTGAASGPGNASRHGAQSSRVLRLRVHCHRLHGRVGDLGGCLRSSGRRRRRGDGRFFSDLDCRRRCSCSRSTLLTPTGATTSSSCLDRRFLERTSGGQQPLVFARLPGLSRDAFHWFRAKLDPSGGRRAGSVLQRGELLCVELPQEERRRCWICERVGRGLKDVGRQTAGRSRRRRGQGGGGGGCERGEVRGGRERVRVRRRDGRLQSVVQNPVRAVKAGESVRSPPGARPCRFQVGRKPERGNVRPLDPEALDGLFATQDLNRELGIVL